MRKLITLLSRLTTFGAGEAAPSGDKPVEKNEIGEPVGEVTGKGGFFDGDDEGGETQPTGNAQNTENQDGEGDGTNPSGDAESGASAETPGDGGDEGEPVIEEALRQSNRARLSADKAGRKPDAPPSVFDLAVSAEAKARFRQLVQEKKDDEAIEVLLKDAGKQVHGKLAAQIEKIEKQLAERARYDLVLEKHRDFLEKYPGAYSNGKIVDNLKSLYSGFETEFGREYADSISLEDYYKMAGGNLDRAKTAKKTTTTKPKDNPAPPAGATKDEVEAAKQKALKGANAPKTASSSAPAEPKKVTGEQSEVKGMMDFVRRRSRPAFTIK